MNAIAEVLLDIYRTNEKNDRQVKCVYQNSFWFNEFFFFFVVHEIRKTHFLQSQQVMFFHSYV